MKFATALIALAASAASAIAGTVTFKTLDSIERTIYFTPSPGSSQLASITVSNAKQSTVTFPDGWVGNYYAVQKGAANKPGMLGEVKFNGWNGLNYYDVSSIVDPTDKNNVKQLYPVGEENNKDAWSGCETFPCNDCYVLPDDVQTKVTTIDDLIQTLGSA